VDGSVEPAIRIVLAEGHRLMRRSLRVLLEREDDIAVLAEATDVATVIREVRACSPDVLVLDLEMPTGSGIAAIRWLHEHAPATRIVALTMQDGPAVAEYAYDAGALGFVLKEFADAELVDAVRDAAAGRHYLSPRVGSRLDLARRFRRATSALGLG
jgi:DNA-binding NarL/FixJ family response regulator